MNELEETLTDFEDSMTALETAMDDYEDAMDSFREEMAKYESLASRSADAPRGTGGPAASATPGAGRRAVTDGGTPTDREE